jgi:hypothetical protein
MSALGQKRTCAPQQVMSAFVLKATEIADIVGRDEGRSMLCPIRPNVDLLRYGEGIVLCRDTGQCFLCCV